MSKIWLTCLTAFLVSSSLQAHYANEKENLYDEDFQDKEQSTYSNQGYYNSPTEAYDPTDDDPEDYPGDAYRNEDYDRKPLAYADTETQNYSKSTYSDKSSDRELLNKIQDKLDEKGPQTRFRNVTVSVYNKEVTLSGTVSTDQDKKDLQVKIEKINGIKTVNNHVTVSPNYRKTVSDNYNYSQPNKATATSQAPNSIDQQLQQKVQDTLKGGAFSRGYDKVTAEVHNGVVTLKGSVESESEKRSLQEKIQDIDGVNSVNNQLTVHSNHK